jgi:hypothetical protein
MLGKRSAQHDLFEVGNVFRLELDPRSFHGQLAAVAPRLFSDTDFASFYAERQGRPSVPPSQLALLTLLQHEAACSDAEAVARSAFDLRWAAVLGTRAGTPVCAKSTFQLFRAHLVLHDGVRTLFERSLKQAREAGLLASGPLKIAVDTTPILGRGAVEDTDNLLGSGITQLIRALAKRTRLQPEAWAEAHDLSRYFAPSLKGSADLDGSDPQARGAFLSQIVTDARRLLHQAGEALSGDGADAVRDAAQLLSQLLLQDVVESPPGPGGARCKPRSTRARLRDGSPRPPIPRSATGARVRAAASPATKGRSPRIERARSSWMLTCSTAGPPMPPGCSNRWSGSKSGRGSRSRKRWGTVRTEGERAGRHLPMPAGS